MTEGLTRGKCNKLVLWIKTQNIATFYFSNIKFSNLEIISIEINISVNLNFHQGLSLVKVCL